MPKEVQVPIITPAPAQRRLRINLPAPSAESDTPGAEFPLPESPNALAQAMMGSLRVSIEGNVGCGKTTVMKALQELRAHNPAWQDICLLAEPVR